MSEKKCKTGVESVAEMMNHMDPENRKRLLENVAKEDPKLAQKIKDKMFTIESLLTINESDLQQGLRLVPVPTLALALRGVSDELLNRIMASLPSRPRKELTEELVNQQPRKKSEVDLAQKEIIKIFKKDI